MLRLDQVDELHALIEQGVLRYSPTLGAKFKYIGRDYPAPTRARPRDPIRDLMFPPRKPGRFLDDMMWRSWIVPDALRGDCLSGAVYGVCSRLTDQFFTSWPKAHHLAVYNAKFPAGDRAK